MKWATPESMHVTLLFLGEVDDRELHAVCRAVKEVAASEPPFPLRVSGVGAFPTPAAAEDPLGGHHRRGGRRSSGSTTTLEARMLDLGCYRKEERGYTPHLTLGRVKGERRRVRARGGAAEAAGVGRRPDDGR